MSNIRKKIRIRNVGQCRYSVMVDGIEYAHHASRIQLDMKAGEIPELLVTFPVDGAVDIELPEGVVNVLKEKEN